MNTATDSALILDYCLGILTGDQKKAFERQLQKNRSLREQINTMLDDLSKQQVAKVNPHASQKDKTWSLLHNLTLEKEMNLSNLPILNKYTDTSAWGQAVAPMLPADLKDYPFMKVLTSTDAVLQVLIMTKSDIPDEVHGDEHESFIILEGECECHIEGKTVRVKAGEFMEIPLHAHHDVKIISERLVGVMQRVKVAA